MPAQSLNTAAFVLLKRPTTADGWQAFTLFSPREGILHAMQRLPGKSAGSRGSLDLFDETDLFLESTNQGRTWFVREARVTARHPGAGRGLESLQCACALAGLIARNGVSEESRAGVATLLESAFAALDNATRPDLIRFKGFYRYARDEGYPVKEQWLRALSPGDREAAAEILGRPLSGQEAAPETVARLQRHLDAYLRLNTEILLD